MFLEAQHEQIIAAAVDPRIGVALSEQPDVASIVLRGILGEQRGLHGLGLGVDQFAHPAAVDEIVKRQRPAGRFIASAHTKRELIDRARPPQMGRLPALAFAMPRNQPGRHHERRGEGIGLDFLQIVLRGTVHRHAPQDVVVV
jgi:hypothetical protein